MCRDGTLDNNMTCTGTEHYIMMWMWHVQGQSITLSDLECGKMEHYIECTRTEHYCLHHHS